MPGSQSYFKEDELGPPYRDCERHLVSLIIAKNDEYGSRDSV